MHNNSSEPLSPLYGLLLSMIDIVYPAYFNLKEVRASRASYNVKKGCRTINCRQPFRFYLRPSSYLSPTMKNFCPLIRCHAPRVKSGTATGAELCSREIRVSSPIDDHSARS